MRIVSLIASATEMVAALGLADQLVGISHECDFPADAVRGRAIVPRPKMDVKRASLDIHKDVELLERAPFYFVNIKGGARWNRIMEGSAI